MKKELIPINDMVDRVFLELFRKKGIILPDEIFKGFPIKRFNIDTICEGISKRSTLKDSSIERISSVLSDLKLLFYFLGNATQYFYLGITTIIGNSNFQNVNLNTLSFLQGNHYKVFLISGIYERILDLLELINFDDTSDHKKNKWGKKYEKLSKIKMFNIITPAEHQKMIDFRDRVRRAEIHGFSSVFRQLKSDRWDHFQNEENLMHDILLRISDEYK